MSDRRARDARRLGHGAGPWRPQLHAVVRRLTERLSERAHPHPELAALVLVDRGRRGLDRPAYARLVGLAEEELAALESGASPPAQP